MKDKAFAALGQAKKFWGALSLVKKIIFASAFVAVIALVLGVSAVGAHENFTVLYADLSPDDASQVTAKLKELKIPYRVDNETSISVPEERVHEVRIDLAGQGLPRGGGMGFELFDKQHLGATDLEQKVMVRRALEGELSRSIASIEAVQTARVHLVTPEKSLFVRESKDVATASVVVKLRPGRTLKPSDVASVVHLVSSAVPGLSESRVSIISSDGVTLHRPNADGENSDTRNEREREIGAQLEARARELLERTVGVGHADVRVSVELDAASRERTEEHYEPQKTALRSEQHTEERANPPTTSVTGVPGAASAAALPLAIASATPPKDAKGIPGALTNLPGAGASAEAVTAVSPGPFRESFTKNFEVDRVTERTVQTSGKIARLSIAVLIDAKKKDGTLVARDQQEVDKLGELVKSAVGFRADRGDALSIESSAFIALDVEEPVAVAPPVPTKLEKARAYAPIALVAVVLLAVVVISLKRKSKTAKTADAMALEAPIFQLENSTVTPKALGAGDVDAMRAAAIEMATKDPATAAVVLRAWLHATPAA